MWAWTWFISTWVFFFIFGFLIGVISNWRFERKRTRIDSDLYRQQFESNMRRLEKVVGAHPEWED